MSKRWLGWLLLLVSIGWSRSAFATLSASPDPINPGGASGVVVSLTASAMGTVVASGAPEMLDHLAMTDPGCPRFTVNPGTLPALVDSSTGITVTVTFAPIARGAVSCVVHMKSVLNAELGSFTVSGTGVAQELSTTPLVLQSFGTVRVANAATLTSQRTIVISNSGDPGNPLQVSALAISGAAATDYTVTTAPTLPATIAPGASINVVITFDPSAAGTRTASLDITSDDPVSPSKSIALTGTGTSARINVTDVSFGIVNAGTTAILSTSVSNTGAAPQGVLRVSSATISGGSWFSFDANGASCGGATTCAFNGGFSVPPTSAVAIRCAPPANASGTQTGSVTFASDSDPGGVSVANLTCTAGAPDIMIATTTLAFGNQLVTTASSPQSVTITNNGNLALTYSIAKSGGQPNAFAITTATGCSTGCTLAAGASTMFSVVFTPDMPMHFATTINVTSNDPDSPTIAIAASGDGTAPQMAATGSLAFGNVEVGFASASQLIVVTNTGTAPLTVSNAGFTAATSDFTALTGTTGAQSTVVAPSATTSWSIVCNPQAQGARAATFRIVSNSFTGATANVPLTCSGQQGVLATLPASPTKLDFGPVPQNTTVTRTYMLRNTGNVAVSNIMATLNLTTVGYSLDPSTPVPSMLAAGASVTLGLKFTPLTGTDGGDATVTFTGTWGSGASSTMAVLQITGDGLTAGFDVSPATIDFGSLRFDQTATRTFCIINTDQANVLVTSPITITPSGSTVTGEFSLVGTPKLQTTCGTGGSNAPLPQTLAPGQILEVTVVANPANRVGPLTAKLRVTTTLAPPNTTRDIDLVATSTSAMLSTTVAGVPTMTVDYGAVDIDQPADTRTITITNTGDGPLDLASFARTANPSFTLTLPANQTLAMGAHLDIAVTYKPTMERAAGQEEQIILSHSIAGVLNGPAMQMITIKGRGIDRHIALAPAPVFPATFRNPGDAAPIGSVMVTNTGDAMLHVSAVMITNDDVWQLLDPSPVAIGANGTHEFKVRFSPKFAGKAPIGLLTIMNDDNTTSSTPMAMVQLMGDGLDRSVTMSDPVIDLGYTGIGIPVTLDNALSITSMDAVNAFTIRSIVVDDTELFSIEAAPTGTALAPSAALHYAITFTPTSEGDFETKAHLFLDMDPTEQGEVTIKGHAVFVDAHGGGGCTTSGGAGTGMLLVIGAFVLRRRRRVAAAAVVLACVLALPVTSRADDSIRNLDLSMFSPTPATTGMNFQLQSAAVGDSGTWVGNALLSYATNPLVLGVQGTDHLAITRRAMIGVGGAFAFLDRFEAGFHLPLYNQDGDGAMYGVAPPSGTARGDLALHGKLTLWPAPHAESDLVLGTSLQLTLPTATNAEFAGVESPTGRVLALATISPSALAKRLAVTLNAGAILRATSRFANIAQGSGVAWGLGASYRVLDPLWVSAEMFGDVVPAGRFDHPAAGQTMGSASTLLSVEYLVGVTYRMERHVSVGVAAGRGLNAGLGTPDLRGVFSLSITPGQDLAPLHPPIVVDATADADGDGIPDAVDKCPREGEDKDMFEDEDGCPDPDNDGDGILDGLDKCPLEAEDKDGFQDDDGCPEKDNDLDGVPDAQDKCPNEAEDKDGFEDLDGCPEADNDHDGILDQMDRCPNEPETINGNQDDDGCPDRGDALVAITPSGLETIETVQFAGAKVSKQSSNVLGQVAATLRARSEILRLKIVAHVQPTDDAERDQALSDKRAEAVRDWLVQAGIAPARLVAKGLGSTKPLVPRNQRGAAALNDRIELIILERK